MAAETSIRAVLGGIAAAPGSRNVRWSLFGAQAVSALGRSDLTAAFEGELVRAGKGAG